MASNQLSDKTRETITETIDLLFGRVFDAYPCPLNMDQLRDMSWALHTDEHMSRIKYLHADYGRLFFVTEYQAEFTIAGYPVRFKEICPADDSSNQFFALPRPLRQAIPDENLRHRLGAQVANELISWVKNAARLNSEFIESWGCLVEVIKMASTPGQLRRMLPDLVTLVNKKESDILLMQQRASSMPFEWAAYDRPMVNRLLDNMAKCKLLPPTNKQWTNRESYTWPI